MLHHLKESRGFDFTGYKRTSLMRRVRHRYSLAIALAEAMGPERFRQQVKIYATDSRIDLLVCRNTLMYFNQETQSRILSRFHFALAPLRQGHRP